MWLRRSRLDGIPIRYRENPACCDLSPVPRFGIQTVSFLPLGKRINPYLRLQSRVTVNQCADLAVARTQKRLSRRSAATSVKSPPLYLIVVKWVKSRAYIVATEAEQSEERLEPQPGYACHVSTWSRIDPLDPAKLSLERAFQMAQVYLYEFDDEMELRPKPEHVMPYAVVKCYWELNTKTAAKLESLGPATGSILILSPKPTRSFTTSASTFVPTRSALLPTPPAAHLFAPRPLLPSTERAIPTLLRGKSSPSVSKYAFERIDPTVCEGQDLKVKSRSKRTTSEQLLIDEKMSIPSVNPLICQTRKMQNIPDVISRLGTQLNLAARSSGTGSLNVTVGAELDSRAPCPNLIGVTTLSWGHPKPEHSLELEVCAYKKNRFPIFDGILNPCLHISRLISHNALHYELAGLTPWPSKPLEPGGPPVLVSITRTHEWCLPRLNGTTAASLQCEPSPFAGYRGNYFRLTLRDTGGKRAEMSQLCQTLSEKSMAGVIHMECDESSVLFVFPDCQFSRSISLPPTDSLDSNYLHAILLTPHSLDHYPYSRVNCSVYKIPNKDTPDTHAFRPASPVPVPTDLAGLGQRARASTAPITDTKLKIPLDAVLSSLPDGGKDLLGTALIALLASQRSSDETDSHGVPQSSASGSTADALRPPLLYGGPRMDPRLSRGQAFDTQSLASVLLSTVAKHPELFKRSSVAPEPKPSDHLTDQSPVISTTVAIPTPKSPAAPETVVGETDPPHPPSAPASPTEPSETKCITPNDFPKEIPLSSSSPTKQTEQLTTPVDELLADSVDMEIEVNGCGKQDLTVTSDMEVSTSFDCHDSPLKLRCESSRYSSHVRRDSAFWEPNARFAFPTQVALLVSDCRRMSSSCKLDNSDENSVATDENASSVTRNSPGSFAATTTHCLPDDSPFKRRDGYSSGPYDGAHDFSFRTSDSTRERTRPDQESTVNSRYLYPRRASHGDRSCSSYVTRSPRYSPRRTTKPRIVYENQNSSFRGSTRDSYSSPTPRSQSGHASTGRDRRPQWFDENQSHPDNTVAKLKHGMLPSPILLLEDISKTHPYFVHSSSDKAVDESEEGEIVDDEAEDFDDNSEQDHRALNRDRSIADGSYTSISSDPSYASLNIIDEWRSSSGDTSFSVSCPKSPRNQSRRRSPRRSKHSLPLHTKHHNRINKLNSSLDVDNRYLKSNTSQTMVSKELTSDNQRSASPVLSRSSVPATIDDDYRLVDQVHSPGENSENSYSEAVEVSLEDKDMRFIQRDLPRRPRGLLPLPVDPPYCPGTSSANSRSDESTHCLGEYDVDYRRLGSESHSSTFKRSRDFTGNQRTPIGDLLPGSSPGSSGSDYLPRYSVYQPKPEVREASRSSRESKRSVSRYEKYSPDSHSSRVAGSSSKASSNRPTRDSSYRHSHGTEPSAKRRTLFREPPTLHTLPISARGLLGSTEPPLLAPPLQPVSLLGGFPLPSAGSPGSPAAARFWSIAQLSSQSKSQLFAPPWR
ncbi:uncharacterized protein DEA37_0008233 [Paragonimus westermani]|uniref:TASOR pseudo-PARP domain-containing protein n=1 Tax=Paragonimus westermani TaxID=34504 RepID=A0A5J4NXK1_9TREM|nr:uncharacterized protein DEA37_0008233 [Paragonimus westermani]